MHTHAKLFQLCLTLCDPMDCSPPGPSVHKDFPDKNTGVANSCPLNYWCQPPISSSVILFTSCLQSFPGVFSNESALCIRLPKYWGFSISPSNLLPLNSNKTIHFILKVSQHDPVSWKIFFKAFFIASIYIHT